MDMSSFGGGQMSDQQKKQIAERMKSMLEKTYVLNLTEVNRLIKKKKSWMLLVLVAVHGEE